MAADRIAVLAPAPQHEPSADSLLAFPDPLQGDPLLQRFLESAVAQLCQWWASSGSRSPLPLLSVLPDLAPPRRAWLPMPCWRICSW